MERISAKSLHKGDHNFMTDHTDGENEQDQHAQCHCGSWRTRLKNHRYYEQKSRTVSHMTPMSFSWTVFWTLVLLIKHGTCQNPQHFYLEENMPVGTVVGTVGSNYADFNPPFRYSQTFPNFDFGTTDGIIQVNGQVDRETKDTYTFLAVSGSKFIEINIHITDVNDNSPRFVLRENVQSLTLLESATLNSKTPLGSVVDADSGINRTQRCEIVGGNIDGTFLLETNRQNGDLVLDLVVNNNLDYEETPFYSLLLRSFDGGSPPRTSTVRINITILDENDNRPLFTHSHYSAYVPENATIGRVVMQVNATDRDLGDNGRVSYEIDYNLSDSADAFHVNPSTGTITVNRHLDYEVKNSYKVVIVARDHGDHPLDDNTVITINVTDVNDNPPVISVLFLTTEDREQLVGHVTENSMPGESESYVARISVSDADISSPDVDVTLIGGEDYFGLVTKDNTVYLVKLSQTIDREVIPYFNMTVTAVDSGDPPLRSEQSFRIEVTDVNDNAPYFEQTTYYADIQEVVSPGSSVIQLHAVDPDAGDNSRVLYEIIPTAGSNSDWFQIDSSTGLITTMSRVDCETQAEPQLVVMATDHGDPPLSGSTMVIIRIRDVNDNQPIFNHSFYNVSVPENAVVGSCVLTVSAFDPDCGTNDRVTYTIPNNLGFQVPDELVVRVGSGDVCIISPLDYEHHTLYEFPVMARDKDGLSATAMVKLNVLDINDNRPVFKQSTYNLNLNRDTGNGAVIVNVEAVDRDSGEYGQVTYSIVGGDSSGLFAVGPRSGVVSLQGALPQSPSQYTLEVQARDGGGSLSLVNTQVRISVLDPASPQPEFSKPFYQFTVSEDAPRLTPVGTVVAQSRETISYTVVAGDPDGNFNINPSTGLIRTNRPLDHDTMPNVVLSVQAEAGNPPTYGQAQVRISITDINDNAPQFSVSGSSIELSVNEDTAMHTEVYWAKATDRDSGNNSRLHYALDDPSGDFTIVATTGQIKLLWPLDHEEQQEHRLLVTATDSGSPQRSATLEVIINVQDVNDNPPVFDRNVYNFRVSEAMAVNHEFDQVHATDADTGNNGRVTYLIQNSEHLETFGIFADTGFLYNKKQLDREFEDQYMLQVVAVDNGIPSNSATAQVHITILDANDNNPIFLNTPYLFFVEENRSPYTSVGFIMADDLDQEQGLTYRLKSPSQFFNIEQNSGEIVTRIQLDRETHESHSLTVVVTDHGNPPRSSSIQLTVRVIDMNDNSPVFTRNGHYTARIKEKKPKATLVTTVSASDDDSGVNGTVTYSLFRDEHNLDWQMFQMHASSGRITTNNVLDHESKPQYVFKVMAKDGGSPSRSSIATIKVTVEDENEEPPVFSSSFEQFNVVENTTPGTIIGSVKALDADTGPNVKVYYYIISGNLYSTFGVNRTTGDIYIIRPVDFEECSEYTMQIMAIDNDPLYPLSSVVSVNISVLDKNDNAPTFEINPVIVIVSENIGHGSHIKTLTAIDLDSGPRGTVRYSIESQSPDGDSEAISGNWVTIDENTGFLYTAADFDYEEVTQITVVVKAIDQPENEEPLFSTISVRIILDDKNDNYPIFQSRTEVSLFEDEPIGFPVMPVIATDQDSHENGNVSYSIASGNQEGHFHLNSYSGLLSLVSMLDRETTDKFMLRISAHDMGHPRHTSHMNLTVYVMDVNDNAPVFENSVYTADIFENNQVGALVTQIRAFDLDEGKNSELEYIIPGGTHGNMFSINSSTGEIFCNTVLDREEQRSWLITAYVKDSAYPALYDTTSVMITVLDVNDNAPQFHEQVYQLEVPENAHLSVIHTIKATDPDQDENGQINYSIEGGNEDKKFSMDSSTGQLFCQPLDREETSSYQLTIMALDGGESPRSVMTTIDIVVLDVNDNNPIFEGVPYAASLPEDTPPNSFVLRVNATDADNGVNALISYSINNSAQGLFKINNVTGVITTTGEFDREKKSSYTFEVYAIDGGLYGPRSRSVRVDIQILDVNDNSPVFQEVPYKAEIGQNFAVNNVVTRVSAMDRDSGLNGTVRYSLVTSSKYFKIDHITGDIRTKGLLTDTEASSVHHLEILASDQSPEDPRHATGFAEIKVGSVPSPSTLRFSNMSYQASVQEHAPRGSEVVVVSVRSSRNDTSAVVYSFASGNENGAFSINPITGIIEVNDPTQLDYETTHNHRLRLIVVATSSVADGYTAVWINLLDINDNFPVFTQDRYTSSVWEGNPKGTFVTQVVATDMDGGENGQLEYFITNGNHHTAFVIDPPNTGIVKTNAILDREVIPSYKLTIEARDWGNPDRKTSTAILKIQVVDENDNAPFFPMYPARHLKESAEVGTEVIQVTANDADLSPALTYTFAPGGNAEETFSIDRYSGRIALAKPLDYEHQTKYTLGVVASDTQHNDTSEVVVHVQDENDNAPLFTQSSYEVSIEELTLSGVSVITVTATDLDSGDNSNITYSMLASDSYYIHPKTGTIYTNKTIEYSSQPTHLVVTATDRGIIPLSSVRPVHVRVLDINNHAPQFIPMVDKQELEENLEKGERVMQVHATDDDDLAENKKIDYSFIDGNEEGVFDIIKSTGEVLLVGILDHERTDQYVLTIMAQDRGEPPMSSTIDITIMVIDVNDNSPEFSQSEYQSQISENAIAQTNVTQVFAYDNDSGLNGRVEYEIVSGNDYNNFEIHRDTGVITVKTALDHEQAALQRLIIKAVDSSVNYPKRSALCTVTVNVTDINEYRPEFPQYMYLEEVAEMKEAATRVFQAQANDKDGGYYGIVTYSLQGADNNFIIESQTGMVKTARMLNYTVENEYHFHVVAQDNGAYQAQVPVVVAVLPQVKPQFSKPNYNFNVPGNAKRGDHIGKVQAFDINGNPSNLIRYSFKEENEYFGINITSGDIYVLKDLQSAESRRRRHIGNSHHLHKRQIQQDNITLIVQASAGPPNLFPSAEVIVLVGVNRTCDGCGFEAPGKGGLSTTAMALIIAFVIVAVILGIVILVMCLRGRDRKSHLADQQHYDTSSFETLDVPPPPMRGNFAPPPYNEANVYPHLNHNNMTTSELSDQSHSASSGRGSAEEADDVDEEIRMINATPLQTHGLRMPDSGIQQDDDAMSEHSVNNHQEYLARLGIDTSKFKINSTAPTTTKSGITTSVESMHQFSDEGGGEGDGLDIHNLVYSKLGEVNANESLAAMDGTRQFGFSDNDKSSVGSLASVMNSDEEFSGSYNWDYLLDWGPQYQPLANVFLEIARLKDDTIKPKTKPTHIVPQLRHGSTSNGPVGMQVRMAGPPPMITDTPPKSIPMGPLGSSLLQQKPSQSQNSLHSSSSKSNSARTSQLTSVSLPKSPLSYESSFTSPAMSPSFTPSLSPLATRSPSISPLMTPKGTESGHTSSGHNTPLRQDPHGFTLQQGTSGSEQEIQI